MLRERFDILPALPEGRNSDVDHVEAIEQVLPEVPLPDHLFQTSVGRHDNTCVALENPGSTHSLELVLLEKPQQFDLCGRIQFPYLVNEEGPAVSKLEPALSGGHRTGESPPFVAEQFTLQNTVGQGSAIDHHKGAIPAIAVVMDRPGHQFLACSAFTLDEHAGSGRSYTQGKVDDVTHFSGDTDHTLHVVPPPEFVQEHFLLADEPFVLKDLSHNDLQLIHLERFRYIVESTQLHGFNRGFHSGVCRDHDHRKSLVPAPYPL